MVTKYKEIKFKNKMQRNGGEEHLLKVALLLLIALQSTGRETDLLGRVWREDR